VLAGTHALVGNTIDGLGMTTSGAACNPYPGSCTQPGADNCDDVCQGLFLDGGTTTFTGNTIDYCKFRIRVRGTAVASATDHPLRFNCLSAFRVEGSGRLRGESNRMRDNGCYVNSTGPRAALVGTSTAAIADFGGGDGSGACVTVNGSCTPSAGLNSFCQS